MLLFTGILFFTSWLQHKIESSVQKQSNGIYELMLYGLQTSPFLGGLSVDSLTLVPDPERWQQLRKQEKDVPSALLEVRTKVVEFRGLNYFGILFGRHPRLDLLKVEYPRVEANLMRQDTTQQSKPLHESVSERMQGLLIGKIAILNGALSYRNASSEAAADSFSVASYNLVVEDLQLDSASYGSKERAYYTKAATLQAQDLYYRLKDGTYKLQAGALNLATAGKKLALEKVHMVPLLEPAQMAKLKGHAVSYTDLRLATVKLIGLDFAAHSHSGKFLLQRLEINGAELSAFKDKKNFTEKSPKPLPHDLAQQVKTPFRIDTVALKRGYVRYEELAEEASETGHITLEKLQATITNVSNMSEHMSMEKPAVAEASAMVMGKAAVSLTARLPLLHENGYHTLQGEIGGANPDILNPILIPTAFLSIQSGRVASARFNIELNASRATGSMQAIYQDLKVDLLSKGEGGDQSFGKKVLTKVANKVAIKSDNPGKEGEEPRVGEIAVERNPEKSVFSYWKDCVVNGFLANIGVAGIVNQ